MSQESFITRIRQTQFRLSLSVAEIQTQANNILCVQETGPNPLTSGVTTRDVNNNRIGARFQVA